ncbi:hypothetical protein FGF04_13620 [Streptomyces apricus]|uniref:Uncharacterized protein n=1 Tax=Streptomyces apricus TaxID=1828112 RepID=A0A5B0B047_9ACTN|nr:hypothetical protein FGF04_13620 [Streptomyces apricus]
MGGVADGSAGADGRREHTPSGVATSCDDGILPFGLTPSGSLPCQNRITGDPRTGPDESGMTGPCTEILRKRRKICGERRGAGDRFRVLRASRCLVALNSHHMPVRLIRP